MGDELASVKVLVDTKDAEQFFKTAQSMQGITKGKITTAGTAGGATKSIVQASGSSEGIRKIVEGLAPGTKHAATYPSAPSAAPGAGAPSGIAGYWNKLIGSTTQKNMQNLNKKVFMLQMASLGVVFSFQSLMTSASGLFQGLGDLGGMLSTAALGQAYAEIATGVPGTDILGMMGVTPEMATAAWAGFNAIAAQFTTAINGFVIKVLSPEMVASILSIIDALATELAKPETVKAVQDIVMGILNMGLQIIPLLPLIAEFITRLSDSGLLGVIIMVIAAAQVLLPTLALLQFMFMFASAAVEGVIAILAFFGTTATAVFTAFAIPVAIVLVLIDFLINLFENFALTGWSVATFVNALSDTLIDLLNVIIKIINVVGGLTGLGHINEWDTVSGNAAKSSSSTTIINNNFNKNVGTGDKDAAVKTANSINNASMG